MKLLQHQRLPVIFCERLGEKSKNDLKSYCFKCANCSLNFDDGSRPSLMNEIFKLLFSLGNALSWIEIFSKGIGVRSQNFCRGAELANVLFKPRWSKVLCRSVRFGSAHPCAVVRAAFATTQPPCRVVRPKSRFGLLVPGIISQLVLVAWTVAGAPSAAAWFWKIQTWRLWTAVSVRGCISSS